MTDYQRRGLIIGLLITVLIVGLLLHLHLQQAQVPKLEPEKPEPSSPPPIWICDGAPDWAAPSAERAAAWWAERGYPTSGVTVGECSDLCKLASGDQGPCKHDAITIGLRHQWFGETHVGETHTDEHAVILLPSSVQVDDMVTLLPDDVEDLVVAHELGHAFNLGHTYTPAVGGSVARQTGHIMHPDIRQTGWGDEGVRQ